MNAEAAADRGLLKAEQVAKLYGVCRKTLRRLAEKGRIPAPIKSPFGNGDQWRAQDVYEHINGLELDSQE